MRLLFSLIISISSVYAFAQKIENVRINQNVGELSFQYDLNHTDDSPFSVSIHYSADKKNWELAEKAYGEVGDSIYPGKSKKFVLWVDHIKNVQDKMVFKFVANYSAVDKNTEGNVVDKTGYAYSWTRYGKTKWMTQNLKSAKTDTDCGGTYTLTNALKSCPEGWHVPTDEEWMDLEIHHGVSVKEAKKHGLRAIDLSALKNSGFTIDECNYKASFYPNQKALAFWTSTENKMLYSGYSDKYLARIIRLDENNISKELRNKSEELSVLCVQKSTYDAKIETLIEKDINLKSERGTVNHPFTGEELEWQHFAGNIWLKKDVLGSFFYKELDDKCPVGWRLPVKQEWEALFAEFKPSLKFENQKEILSERLSASGPWSISLSYNDYWMTVGYYTYNTFWINEKDKEDSEKVLDFPTNDKGSARWESKQTNEKAKVRCLLDNENFLAKMKSIKSGTFMDQRDQNEYGFVEIDSKVWMAENLRFDMGENSMCRDNIKKDCELFGHMYNLEITEKGCPDGWRLPTSEEWKYLLINKAANNLKILYPFGGTGFNLLLGGEIVYDEVNKMDIYTARYLFKDGDDNGYYYIDSKGKVEFNGKAKKRDFYYVRCVKERNNRF